MLSFLVTTRRVTLKGFILGLAGLTLILLPSCASNDYDKTWPVKLGVASYSLRAFDRAEAISMIKEMGVKYVNIKFFHLTYESTPEEIAAARKEFADAGLTIVGGGTITLREDSDEAMRPLFEYAKAAGMPVMVVAPSPQTLPRIEKFAKEYDIKIAIHNHGPEDKHFPAPKDALDLVKDMDLRMGVCVDVGHTTRTGADVVQAIAEAGDRLHDIHIKDMVDLMDKDSQVDVGEGAMPIKKIFKQLKKMHYEGLVNLEYEINKEDPLAGMKKSFDYMRQVLADLEK